MNKQVSVLSVIALLALGAGVWLNQLPSKDEFEASLLFDDLQKSANQVDSVEITNTQGVLLSAQKLGDRWLATFDPEQPVYPVAQENLATFVKALMTAKLVEAKTSKPQSYIRLGLQPVDIEDSMASLVTLKAGDNSWQVLVGNKVALGEGQYILKFGDSQSWRTDKTINLPIDNFSWLKQPILPYQAQNISSVVRVDNFRWKITRSSNGDFQLADMPKDKELEYESILNSIVNSLTSLNFEQLLAVDENFSQSLNVLTQLEVSTDEQEIFQVIVSEQGDKRFVNFSSNERSEYWQNWYYQISNFSAQQLIKTLDDFLVKNSAVRNDDDTQPKIVEEGDSPN